MGTSLTEVQGLLLAALIATEKAYGHVLGDEVRSVRGPTGVGSIYRALHALEASGYVASKWEIQDDDDLGRPRRRLYNITPGGKAALREFQRRQSNIARRVESLGNY